MHVKRIERFTKQLIPVNVVEGYEPKKPAPHHAPRVQAAGSRATTAAAPSQASVRSANQAAPRREGVAGSSEGYKRPGFKANNPTIATAHVAATATVNPAR
jgi:hypothetical protein